MRPSMLRLLVIAVATSTLTAGLALAEPRVEVHYYAGVPQLVLSGEYRQAHYTIWRAPAPDAPFTAITAYDVLCLGSCFADDYSAQPGQTYWYRFDVAPASSAPLSFGPYRVAILAPYPSQVHLRVFPNPAPGRAQVEFYLLGAPNDAPLEAQAAIHDLQGRKIRTLWTGPLRRGITTVSWDGHDDSGRRAGIGRYFLRLTSPLGTSVQPLILVR